MAASKSVAVVGGGINGLMASMALAHRGIDVTVFEKGKLLSETSSASSKLLHGGIRYLEHGQIALVRESLKDRAWWLNAASQHCWPLQMIIPIYKGVSRSSCKLWIGAKIYQALAGKYSIGESRWLSKAHVEAIYPELKRKNLEGAIGFFDAMMDDAALGNWVVEQVRNSGVSIKENQLVEQIDLSGHLCTPGEHHRFDAIVNAAGPWARQILCNSGIATDYDLTLVRGSHLLLDRQLKCGLVFQVPGDARIVFALPHKNQMLLGTTEVKHDQTESAFCTKAEADYLLNVASEYLSVPCTMGEVQTSYAGIRPIVSRANQNISSASRESIIECRDRLVTIFGGKWTSSRSLGEQVANKVVKILH